MDRSLPSASRHEQPAAPDAGPAEALALVALGHEASTGNRFPEAERCFRKALALDPGLPMAHNNLGWALQQQGRTDEAIGCYRKALELNGNLKLARINLAALLSMLGRVDEANASWRSLLAAFPNDRNLLEGIISCALRDGDLTAAAVYAGEYAARYRGDAPFPSPLLTISQLEHDIGQFRYLQKRGMRGIDFGGIILDFEDIIYRYERVLAGAREPGRADGRPLDESEYALVGPFYGRMTHRRETPRVGRALSRGWNAVAAEDSYLSHPLGLLVIDDFLSEEALLSLRQFCLESTVWFTNRYAHGRLGAFFREGFNCPLLLQIAEELRLAFPRIIGDTHRVMQIWGFKYGHVQPATCPHADFAAVNVNLWLTPDEANLDSHTGGMIVYDLEAPLDWDFYSYNEQGTKISALLREKNARAIPISYRANRAVIFNSDLFHATQPLSFRAEYENRRINVTMLFGKREAAPRIHSFLSEP